MAVLLGCLENKTKRFNHLPPSCPLQQTVTRQSDGPLMTSSSHCIGISWGAHKDAYSRAWSGRSPSGASSKKTLHFKVPLGDSDGPLTTLREKRPGVSQTSMIIWLMWRPVKPSFLGHTPVIPGTRGLGGPGRFSWVHEVVRTLLYLGPGVDRGTCDS